jgi:chromosome segregation ATPase
MSYMLPDTGSLPPNSKATSSLQSELEITRLHKEIERLKLSITHLGDEVLSLKGEARSYREEVASLNCRLQMLESQALKDTPALIVGREVRLRYLEHHRQRMGRSISKQGHECIKAGDRAAHRGRPVVDAMLCLMELMRDHEVLWN